MTDEEFWTIVDEIGWPNVDYDKAKKWFMQNYPTETAEAFRQGFQRRKAELRQAGGVGAISDSWDDTLAHVIGMGKREYERNINLSTLLYEREAKSEYRESFAYCIPFESDYGYLRDDGYEDFKRFAREHIAEIDDADPDDIPPKLLRRFPEVREICELLLAEDWPRAVARYHALFGAGYADDWPMRGFAVPNFVQTLEVYRL